MTSGKDKDKRTLVANLNDVKDSLECTASGERFKNICKFPSASHTHQPPMPFLANRRQNQETKLTKVFELPLNEFCNRYVNLEFLYGTCPPPFVPSVFPLLSLSCLSPNAAITSPSALKLLLIFCVSFTLSFSGNPF